MDDTDQRAYVASLIGHPVSCSVELVGESCNRSGLVKYDDRVRLLPNNVFNAWLVDLEGKDPSQATVGAEAPKAVGLPYVCEVSRIAPDADVGIWAGVEKWR